MIVAEPAAPLRTFQIWWMSERFSVFVTSLITAISPTNTSSVSLTVRVVVLEELGYTSKLPSAFLYCHCFTVVFSNVAVSIIDGAEIRFPSPLYLKAVSPVISHLDSFFTFLIRPKVICAFAFTSTPSASGSR